MRYVGVDLHKKTSVICVVELVGNARKVVCRKRFFNDQTKEIYDFFVTLGEFQVVVEATASYEWFLQLVEALADRVVLAHPKHLRIIAESKNKSDKIDSQVLAEFLALDMIPQAYRPGPRQREHRALVRQRRYLQGRITSVKNKLRNILSNYNQDRAGLFSTEGRVHLANVRLSTSDRFVVNQLTAELEHHEVQLNAMDKQLRQFANEAPIREQEAREVLDTVPCVGPVTIEVVISELGDVRRFDSLKEVAAYGGLAPGRRESAGRARDLGITKEGSRLLRWAMVELAWRLTSKTQRWHRIYHNLKARMGAKKAIVAVARRVLCVLASLLRSGQQYNKAMEVHVKA